MDHHYVIHSDNLDLLPVKEQDIEMLRNWRNDPQNQSSFLTTSFITAEQQRAWYRNYLNKKNDLMFMIYDKLSNSNIGMCSLYNINSDKQTAEFGRLLIGETSARGRGLGFLVTYTLCNFGFNTLNFKEINLEVLEENTTAYSLYRKIGFLPYDRYNVLDKIAIKMSISREKFNEFN
ncbi:GNAT family N-acetyltransferase [Paenibacillus sp. J22TS3]|uniref:GNAT family N-acetyltransferase n=1 Tax=Paenibacillus sp. J22TS3 TaxID=2807192 RepID=UPI001B00CA20|nr:GNAT family N-acetyltransferase [Paenibacillus sp. J22TS3]GIP21692.1 hypothetical protein J22TS3_19670 [Paenibacillus sp. J22TS3]